MDTKAIAAIVAAAAVSGIGTLAALSDQCYEVTCVVPVVRTIDGKEVQAKAQKTFRLCGDEKAQKAALPPGTSCAPATATKPSRTLTLTAKQLAPEEVGSPCACAPTVPAPKAAPCEALSRAPGGSEAWGKAPPATTIGAGLWRGGCVLTDCWETNARDSVQEDGTSGAGSTLNPRCKPPISVREFNPPPEITPGIEIRGAP